MTNKIRLGFIGAGALATILSTAFKQRGFMIAAISSRGFESAKTLAGALDGCIAVANNQQVADNADMVFIATPDDVIPLVASQVLWRKGQMVIHCSGADSIDILDPAKTAGSQTGVFHPLQTFAAMLDENLKGITFAIEAEEPLLAQLKEMAQMLGGNWIELKSKDRVIYHAAAVFACNYLVTLADIAVGLWESIDVPRYKAVQALLPLMRGTINNIEAAGVMQSLTGPIARGDLGTIKRHISALQSTDPELIRIYSELGKNTIPLALEKGKLDIQKAKEMEHIFNKYLLHEPEC
ncbi:MAG: DUF2520 domain-containing protein [Dehalococcoidales bacterium]|nr:DUF2520 domain-containing protein [Dehalococcoidales bacterium]